MHRGEVVDKVKGDKGDEDLDLILMIYLYG
jgi:hypothetical protein